MTDTYPGGINIWSTGFDLLGEATVRLVPQRHGVLRARRMPVGTGIVLHHQGPEEVSPSPARRCPRETGGCAACGRPVRASTE